MMKAGDGVVKAGDAVIWRSENKAFVKGYINPVFRTFKGIVLDVGDVKHGDEGLLVVQRSDEEICSVDIKRLL